MSLVHLHCRVRGRHCGPSICACNCADCFNARHNMNVPNFTDEDAWSAPTKVRVIEPVETEEFAELPQVPIAHCTNSVYCDRAFCMCQCARCYQAKQKEGAYPVPDDEVVTNPRKGRVEIFDTDLANEVYVCCACGRDDGRGMILGGSDDRVSFLAFCPFCQDGLLIAMLHRKVIKVTGRAGGDGLSTTTDLPKKPEEAKETSDAA